MDSTSLIQQHASTELRFVVRVVKTVDDPFAGLKGRDYIKARNLAPPVQKRVQTSAHEPLLTSRGVCK